jgi:DNA primase
MPLAFSKVTRRLDPARFTIRTAPALLRKDGDACRDVLGAAIDVPRVLAALETRLARAAASRRRRRG